MIHAKNDLNKALRYFVVILLDLIAVTIASIISLMLRFDLQSSEVPVQYYLALIRQLPILFALNVVTLYAFRQYSSIWRFAGVTELVRVVAATLLSEVVFLIYSFLIQSLLPRAFYVIDWLLTAALIGGLRVVYRVLSRFSISNFNSTKEYQRVMLIGAGNMGTIMIEELINEEYKYGKAVVLVDDDPKKKGKSLRGLKIAGSSDDIPSLVDKYCIDKIIFCIPSASLETKKRILSIALSTGRRVMITQSIHESLTNGLGIKSIRDVDVSDLLTRPEVSLDANACRYITNQVVLVTGGGGSIGSELCRQAAQYRPKQIIIFDIYENNAYELQNELNDIYHGSIDIQIRIGSVRDIKRLEQVFKEFRPAVVFHAAAHKHVPILEDNPCEAVKNNIFGTLNTAKVASEYGVSVFVLLSTDKAVNPTNIMGATKRITEMLIQAIDSQSKTIFAAVRFGNVLGSNGSVIPLFKKQIEKGGPVTVTHPDITRYFMTIPEAAQLVIQAGGLAKGGEIFLLDMGEPVKILDLAHNLIRMSGLEPDKDIKIEFTGLRPGEKLYEELTYQDEEVSRQPSSHKKILITTPAVFDRIIFKVHLDKIRKLAEEGNVEELKKEIQETMYNPVGQKELKMV
jgi:FlaA1/EpsC-like NDP-sugar epimerase